MSCHICGDEPAPYRPGKRQALCESCDRDTPNKVRRSVFERAYWRAPDNPRLTLNDVPESIRREFYDDYLTSSHTVREYIRATTERA